jgi:transposase
MLHNRHLARSIADSGFAEFRRQLEYKAAMTGTAVVVVDRFFPSSKTCSDCGTVNRGLLKHPGGELRRVSLWRGWLWRRASACRETVLDEAGIGRVLFWPRFE